MIAFSAFRAPRYLLGPLSGSLACSRAPSVQCGRQDVLPSECAHLCGTWVLSVTPRVELWVGLSRPYCPQLRGCVRPWRGGPMSPCGYVETRNVAPPHSWVHALCLPVSTGDGLSSSPTELWDWVALSKARLCHRFLGSHAPQSPRPSSRRSASKLTGCCVQRLAHGEHSGRRCLLSLISLSL